MATSCSAALRCWVPAVRREILLRFGLFVPNVYNNELWRYLNMVMCIGTLLPEISSMAPRSVRSIRAGEQVALEDVADKTPVHVFGMDGTSHQPPPGAGTPFFSRSVTGIHVVANISRSGTPGRRRYLVVP
jgi:hypothetical protein